MKHRFKIEGKDEWLEIETGRDIIKQVWNKAIMAAADIVREKFDEMEPWIEPEDIEKLLRR